MGQSRLDRAGAALLGLLLAGPAAGQPSPEPDAIRRELAGVFRRAEFRPKDSSLWQRFWDFIRPLFDWLSQLHDLSPALFWALLVGCVVLLILLLAHIVWTVRQVFYTAGTAQPGRDDAARRRLSAGYAEEAARRAQEGDYTEAIRCLFLALVYRFDESGRIGFQKACTNREYLALLDDQTRARQDLEVFVDLLDDHWYGQRPADLEQYERCRLLFDRLR